MMEDAFLNPSVSNSDKNSNSDSCRATMSHCALSSVPSIEGFPYMKSKGMKKRLRILLKRQAFFPLKNKHSLFSFLLNSSHFGFGFYLFQFQKANLSFPPEAFQR